jgi:hypothetical protein
MSHFRHLNVLLVDSGGSEAMIATIPNELRDAITEKLDAAILKEPDAEKDREALYPAFGLL